MVSGHLNWPRSKKIMKNLILLIKHGNGSWIKFLGKDKSCGTSSVDLAPHLMYIRAVGALSILGFRQECHMGKSVYGSLTERVSTYRDDSCVALPDF